MNYTEAILETIKEEMNIRGVTQKQLDQRRSISPSSLNKIFQGNQRADFELIANIAEYLKISIDNALFRSSPNTKFLVEIEVSGNAKIADIRVKKEWKNGNLSDK